MKRATLAIFLAVFAVAGASFIITSGILEGVFPLGGEISCPSDSSPYVLTPIGTRSENFAWKCLVCGHAWTKSYPEDVYAKWRKAFLEPDFVRDYAVLYLRDSGYGGLPDPLKAEWSGGRETPEGLVGSETYVYRAEGAVVTVKYPVVLAENVIYEISVELSGTKVWKGRLHQRQFSSDTSDPLDLAAYDFYGGVGLFERGIYVIATSKNPLALYGTGGFWENVKEHVTNRASAGDFVSILVSRGDFPTGGHQIQLKSFSRLEGDPVILSFSANFTDPGEGVAVSQAFTNPLVLVPVGNLDAGKYLVEVHIVKFLLTYDADGKPVYVPILTFKEEVWTLEFEVA
ncbi:MAG: protease complex subunit PrcB family protein [Thermoproteota archaeon]